MTKIFVARCSIRMSVNELSKLNFSKMLTVDWNVSYWWFKKLKKLKFPFYLRSSNNTTRSYIFYWFILLSNVFICFSKFCLKCILDVVFIEKKNWGRKTFRSSTYISSFSLLKTIISYLHNSFTLFHHVIQHWSLLVFYCPVYIMRKELCFLTFGNAGLWHGQQNKKRYIADI